MVDTIFPRSPIFLTIVILCSHRSRLLLLTVYVCLRTIGRRKVERVADEPFLLSLSPPFFLFTATLWPWPGKRKTSKKLKERNSNQRRKNGKNIFFWLSLRSPFKLSINHHSLLLLFSSSARRMRTSVSTCSCSGRTTSPSASRCCSARTAGWASRRPSRSSSPPSLSRVPSCWSSGRSRCSRTVWGE